MPQLQHFKWLLKHFFRGAEPDNNKELSGEKDSGAYIDANNMRYDNEAGENYVLKKINGEENKYPNVDNACTTNTMLPLSTSYKCIGIAKFFSQEDKRYHEIEFWADTLAVDPSLIRIDGKIVLRSVRFPIDTDHPLQIAVNDSCIGGEIYTVDFLHSPMLFNLKDLMVNSSMLPDESGNLICTQKYFNEFNISEFLLELNLPVDHPVFVQLSTSAPFGEDSTHLVFLNPSGGFKVGQVQYAIRFVTSQGDKTAWSMATPLIAIPFRLTTENPPYPWVRSIGAPPTTVTPYGVHFRFRCVNILNYDFIQVKRISYVTNSALGTLGIEEQLATNIDITNGQIGIIDVYDRASIGIPLSDNQAITGLAGIETAKAIRYLNQRLFLLNVKYSTRDLDNTVIFKTINGEETFPVIQNIDKGGHNDPYTRSYYKSEIRGEKASHSVTFFDNKGISSFAVPLTTNYQFPNRRDELAAGSNSETYSQDGVVKAANVNGSVTNTFEVFDLSNAITKTDACSFKNILKDITVLGVHVAGKGVDKVNAVDCNPVSASHPPSNLYTTDSVGYQPFRPTGQGDSGTTSHDYWINTKVRRTGGTDDIDYNPKGFAPTYYSMGLGMAGVDVNSLPYWVQSFSINRSKSAKRVFCQGLGYYKLVTATGLSTNTSKVLEQIWFHSPDIHQQALAFIQTVVDDVAAGGTRFKLQLVSPLGFFSEVYNGDLATTGASNQIDMINYCRIIRENGDINTGDGDGNVGINGGDGYGYVAYGKWRNPNKPNNVQRFAECGDGNQLFDITSIASTMVGRQEFYTIATSITMFNHQLVGGTAHDFDDENVKKFHEPVYMVNIIDTQADIPNTNINDYLETSHYQKIDAIIGKSNASKLQVFPLVDERREDCIPDVGNSAQNCIAFVKFNGSVSAWLNVVEKSPAQLLVILNGIQAGTLTVTFNGVVYTIKGVYTSTKTTISIVQSEYEIVFDAALNPGLLYPPSMFVPLLDSFITVKYDSSIPIKVFGGEGIIGESVFAPLDLTNNDEGTMDTTFSINIGWPYRAFQINPRVYIVNRANGVSNFINDNNEVKLFASSSVLGGKMRQLLAMYTCESRIDMCYAYNLETGSLSHDMYFPQVHYIMRPNQWSNPDNIQAQYFVDYPSEETIWGNGGFRFLPQTLLDYSHLPETQTATGKPKIGFKEETDFCTRIIWSELRPINIVNAPGVRSFNPLNFFDISDNTGQIKYAYDDRTDKNGANLYAFTNSGVCLLMTDKRVLHELTGSQLAAMGSDETSVILQQIWMSKVIGMDDEMWRSAAEHSNVIWWTNYDSVYQLEDGKITDIARASHYHSKIYNEFIDTIQPGYQDDVMAIFDTLNNEYWVGGRRHAPLKRSFSFATNLVSVKDIFIEYTSLVPLGVLTVLPGTLVPGDSIYIEVSLASESFKIIFIGPSILIDAEPGDIWKITLGVGSVFQPYPFSATKVNGKMYVYSNAEDKKHFVGTFDYSYDKFVCVDNIVLGARRMETDTLNEGFVINGTDIFGYSTQVYSPEQFKDKEFIRYRANTDTKPSRVEFFYNMDEYHSESPICILDTTANDFALRNRNGWEQYINREDAVTRKRAQGRSLIVKTIHDRPEDYKMIDEGIQFKVIK